MSPWSVLCFLCYIEHENFANGGEALTQMKHRANRIPHAGLPRPPQLGMKTAQVVILNEAKDLVVETLGC